MLPIQRERSVEREKFSVMRKKVSETTVEMGSRAQEEEYRPWRSGERNSSIKQEQSRVGMDANEGRSVSLVAKRKTFHWLVSIFSESRSAGHQLIAGEEKAV